MPRHHYLPATFLALFSADKKTQPARNRQLFIGDRQEQKIFKSATHNVGAVSNLYTLHENREQPFLIDEIWSEYETKLSDSVARLVSGEIDAITWARVLVPFVAGMLVRGPDFNYRFEQRLQYLGIALDDVHFSSDNTNFGRILELQRLLGPIAVARWTVVTAHGSEAQITNDLGYAPFLNPWTQDYGMAIPLGSEHVLTVVPRTKGIIVTVRNGQWVPAINYVDNVPDNHQDLNRAIASIAQRFIFGPEQKLIDKYLNATEIVPRPLEPQQLGFLDAREARAHEFTWHRLVALLEHSPDDDAAWDFDLDWELISKGWCPPVYFPTNLPEFPVALKRIDDSIEVNFYAPSIYYALADIFELERLGDYEQLVTNAEQALEIAEEQEHINKLNLALAAGLEEQGRLEESIAIYDKVLEDDPLLALAHCNKGVALCRANYLDKAKKSLTRAIELDPSLGEAWLNRGTILAESNDHESAIQDFTAAIPKLPPGYAKSMAYMSRGNSLLFLNRFTEATSDFGAGIKEAPSLSDKVLLLTRRASAYRAARNITRALEDLEQAIALVPEFHLAYQLRATLYGELGMIEETIADYTQVATLADDNEIKAQALWQRAIWRSRKGQYHSAMDDFNLAETLISDDKGLSYDKGVTLLMLARFEEAIFEFNRELAQDPRNARAVHNRGIVYAAQGEHRKAIRDFRKAVRYFADDPEVASVYRNKAVSFAFLERWRDAEATLALAMNMAPDAFLTIQSNGQIAFLKGNFTEASEIFAHLNRVGLSPYYYLPLLIVGSGNKALEELRRFKQEDPTPLIIRQLIMHLNFIRSRGLSSASIDEAISILQEN